MAISKQVLKTKPECKVRFSLTAQECDNAEQIHIAGEFNGWDHLAAPMRRQKNGDFALEMNLPTGRSFKFRYLADGSRWLNDPSADGYERCEFAQADNSVLNL